MGAIQSFPDGPITYEKAADVDLRSRMFGEGQTKYIKLNNSSSDVKQIIAILSKLVPQYSKLPIIREFTVSHVICRVDNNDLDAALYTISEFVRNNVKYMPDPNGSEYVIAPPVMVKSWINGKRPIGDCDDHVILLNSMLESVGIKTKIVGVKLGSEEFNHVITSAKSRGGWVDIDPCSKNGNHPAYIERLVV